MRVDVAFLPPDESPERETCLVVDVLRATSCMAVLFGRGMRGIYPAASVDEARALRATLREELAADVALFGEQNALPPEGFDRGNSPSEFATIELPWREAVVATTNGTPALLACARVPLVLAAAPLNAAAVTAAAIEAGDDVIVVCAGRRGAYADDDVLAAGMLARRLVAAGASPAPNALHAIAALDSAHGDLAGAMRRSVHGRDLVAIGFGHDIDFCGEPDRFSVAGALQQEGAAYVLRPLQPATEP